MLEKLLVLLFQGKSLVLAGALATGVVVTGTFGGEVVRLVITPLTPPAFPADPLTEVQTPRLGEDVRLSPDAATVDGRKVYTVTGWSIDRNTEEGSGVAKVELFLGETKLGEATLGLDSPDVAAAHRTNTEDARFVQAGWEFQWDVTDLPRGNHTLYAIAHSSVDSDRTSNVAREIADPLVGFVKPEAGNKVAGEVKLSGWALDRFVAEGTASEPQIEKVELLLNGALLGHATLGLDSPDGLAADNGVAKAGWEYVWDASALEPDEYTLTARAHSSAQVGAWTEATLLVIVELPKADGNGCGWLVGTARGEAVAALQSGWEKFHNSTQAYRGKMESVEKTKREQFSVEIDRTKNRLLAMRDAALAAIHAKADEYLRLCEAGRLPAQPTVTYPQSVVGTSHLLYEYRTLVDKAMVDMQAYFNSRKTVLNSY